jgi:hypothetical protein
MASRAKGVRSEIVPSSKAGIVDQPAYCLDPTTTKISLLRT